VRDMISVLQDEGFEVQERDVNRIRQKNGWLLRMDTVHFKKKRPASTLQGASPDEESDDEGEGDGDGDGDEEDGEEETSATPGFGIDTPGALPDMDLTQAQAEAFQEARRRAIAADAEEKRVTKKRRRWLKGRAGLPADPPGPPRFPSELSLTECKAVLSMDAAVYKDVRAKFRRICEEEGVIKKTIAGPHKWEAIKLQLVRESMHLRGVFWDNLNMDQKNLALDLICCDVTKNIRSEGSRMMLHEARNILGLNPKIGRDVRFHFQKILHEDHFVGKIVAGEEHWNDLVQRWLSESDILRPIAESLDSMDPNFTQKKKAIEAVARDAMKRFRDAEARGTIAKTMQYEQNGRDDQQDADGHVEHENGADNTAMDMTGLDDGSFEAAEAAQIAAQLSMEAAASSGEAFNSVTPADNQGQGSNLAMPTDDNGPSDSPAPPKKKRGRPRKLPYPENPPEEANGEPPVKKARGRQSKRIPQEEALRIYAHSQARFLPPDASSGQGSSVSAEPDVASTPTTPSQPGIVNQQQYRPAPASAPASASASASVPVPSPSQPRVSTASSTSTPIHVRPQAQAQAQAQGQARARAQVQAQVQASTPIVPAPQRTATAIYFRLQPTSTVTGVPGMWIATLTSRSVRELRSKAVAKSPGAVCVVIDGIVKDGMGGEVPLPIPGDTELEAYLGHMQETHGPPTFSVQLVKAPGAVE
jgi:hypothetical protein